MLGGGVRLQMKAPLFPIPTVAFLHATNRLAHHDLKTENIVFHDSKYYNFLTQEGRDKGKKVKILINPGIRLIDFGSTTFDHEHHRPRPLRPCWAPEVVLELGFHQSSDVWLVGCIIFEMAMGFKMFDTNSSHEHLAMVERILGKIPSKIVNKSKLKYFSNGKLRWDEDSSHSSGGRHVRRRVKPLLRYIPREQRGNEDWEELLQMIIQMLRYEPMNWSTLVDCLQQHPFLKKFKIKGLSSPKTPPKAQRLKFSQQAKTSWYSTQVHEKPARGTPSSYQHLVLKHRKTEADSAHKQWHQKLYVQIEKNSKFVSGNGNGGNSNEEVEFFLILCEGIGSTEWGGHSVERQVRQAKVLLKSAVLFSRKRLHFHVIADSTNLFKRLVNQTVGWPDGFKKKIRFTMHDVWYPEGKEGMRLMFRACATERLFVPEMFPAMDKAVYIDTDVIFMRPPEDLWSFFDDFSSSHIAAMARGSGVFYRSEKNKVPYYGENGLNAGVMLMHLDRMRAIPGWWLGATIAIHDEYKERLKLADQDILNILFSSYPEKLYDLPCEWNYYHCRHGFNDCHGAQQNGVSILHGNALSFVRGNEMKLQTIFELFDEFQLGQDSIEHLYTQIVANLGKVDQEDLPSNCKAVAGIDRILLGEMEKHLSSCQQ